MTAPAPAAGRWRLWLDRLAVGPVDVAVAIGVGLLQVGATAMAAHHQHVGHAWDGPALAALAVGPLALAERRRYPVAVLATTFGSTVAYALVADGRGAPFLALIVAFLTAVAAGHRRAAVGAMVIGYVGFTWLGALSGRQQWPTAQAAVGLAAWLLVLLGVGEALRVRRERATEAAHVRDEEGRRKLSEERLRIARELHDILAHNISVINVQAATSLHRAERTEERAYAALATIKQVSQETLVELRSLLGTLREVDERAPRAPAPSLARLDDLVASAAATGVMADVEVRGRARPLPPGVDLAAYRIVQEALTNVARHAGTPRAEVLTEFGEDDLVIQVDDAGRARGEVAPGTGILGMTERAAALGGDLIAGPRPGGGFRVRARLPLRGQA